MDERKAFEAWWSHNKAREIDGRYSSMETELVWQAWQAATAAERERAAKVCEAEDVASTDDAIAVQECIAAAIRKG